MYIGTLNNFIKPLQVNKYLKNINVISSYI